MSDEAYSFSTARVRLEEIVSQVRKKDTSLEKSLDLLEEGVRLANACTELIEVVHVEARHLALILVQQRGAGRADHLERAGLRMKRPADALVPVPM